MPRTKKSPTPTPAKATGAELPKETPKGSGPSLPPALEARVAALEKAFSIVLVHIPAAFFETQAAADGPTRRILDELEDRIEAGVCLARVLLPEDAHDEAMAEYEALPADAKERSRVTRDRMFSHLTAIGAV